jgi:hypothetical protein
VVLFRARGRLLELLQRHGIGRNELRSVFLLAILLLA